ncbi:MAG: PilZ domain-containing protein [Methylomonas sp.]|nr:MAG: PilZ domain-containing protein [Methylomonas sp.]PPD27926.1 MAG: PilZ domain-containing protein [Methylomonas sp.]PPD40036.1 MAG: PilZ domain-containing protein [Methylomonas sp.]PPD41576.1 MAG: PilZ domain-containing protein [Methylomonas sp.]PPD51969.1 MAG: PilZ domain-containing protein [Methylomonas sp.]
MKPEKRNHKRIKPQGLKAGLTFNAASQEIALDADIIDISYSGIRVKLKTPIAADMTGNVRINMTLPESNTPFSVHGILKHQSHDDQCGLHYVDHVEGSIDDLMFECVELDETTVLIKHA